MRNSIVLFLVLAIIPLKSFAYSWKDFGEEIAVPVTETPILTMTGISLVAGSFLIRTPHGKEFERSEAETRRLGHYSSWGDYAGQLSPNALYSGYQWYLGSNGDSEGYRRSLGMLKATFYAGLVTSVGKYTVRAPRPTNSDERNSFPSGHSATVFTFAGYVLSEHGVGAGSLAMGLAVFSGYSRIHDQRHRIHEVLAGATIGLAYGIGMSRLQKKQSSKAEDSTGFSIAPILDFNTKGFAIYKEF